MRQESLHWLSQSKQDTQLHTEQPEKQRLRQRSALRVLRRVSGQHGEHFTFVDRHHLGSRLSSWYIVPYASRLFHTDLHVVYMHADALHKKGYSPDVTPLQAARRKLVQIRNCSRVACLMSSAVHIVELGAAVPVTLTWVDHPSN